MRRPTIYITARQSRHSAAKCPRGVECDGRGCRLSTGKTDRRKARAKAKRDAKGRSMF